MRKIWQALALLFLASAAHADIALNPDVTQDNIQQTICAKGYTKTVRPPSSYTNKIKFRLMAEQGIPREQSKNWALDHRVPLVLGGDPVSTDNLRLLTEHDNTRKSRLEVKLRCLVCSGQILLEDAQQAVYQDWEAAYTSYQEQSCK